MSPADQVYAQNNTLANSTTSQTNLKVLFTIFGINNRTGDILGFITVNNHSDYRIIRSSEFGKGSTGIGQFEMDTTGGRVNAGDQYNACIVLLSLEKNMQRDCIISYKLPAENIDHVAFSLNFASGKPAFQ